MSKKMGRPPMTQKQRDLVVQKLKPFLQSGLSIRKACLEAGIPRSTLYYLMETDKDFADKTTICLYAALTVEWSFNMAIVSF